jgi:hypothetical protein
MTPAVSEAALYQRSASTRPVVAGVALDDPVLALHTALCPSRRVIDFSPAGTS